MQALRVLSFVFEQNLPLILVSIRHCFAPCRRKCYSTIYTITDMKNVECFGLHSKVWVSPFIMVETENPDRTMRDQG